jgi:hypothetical protein
MRLPVAAREVRKLLQEIDASSRGDHVLAVGGVIELAAVLRRQLFRGGAHPAAVRLGEPEGADAYIHVLASEPTEEDEATLRRADRARVPTIAVVSAADVEELPYVLATDVVRVDAGQAFPLEEIGRTVAARLGENGAPLAARIPLLRGPVCEELTASFARKNGLFAAALWIPGPDLPVLALNELRLVLRLAQAHGERSGRERLPELAAVLGAGFGLRALARALDRVPATAWMARGAVAYAGTRALGEAARRRFELGPTRQPAAAARGAL